MSPTSEPISDDLLKLEEFLRSEAVSANCIQLSELDGFLTGIVAGPEPIPVEEWMDALWEGELPQFADEAQRTEILAAITRHWSEIAKRLDEGEWEIQPVFWSTEDGEIMFDEWAEGFLSAMRLRWDAWHALFEDPKIGDALVPILILCNDEDGEPLITPRPSPGDPILKALPGLIPEAVADIYDFWLERELTPQPIRVAPKTGRNERCPCNSGKKFKHCCGAA